MNKTKSKFIIQVYKTKATHANLMRCLFTGNHSTEDASLLQYTEHTGPVMTRPAKELSEIC